MFEQFRHLKCCTSYELSVVNQCLYFGRVTNGTNRTTTYSSVNMQANLFINAYSLFIYWPDRFAMLMYSFLCNTWMRDVNLFFGYFSHSVHILNKFRINQNFTIHRFHEFCFCNSNKRTSTWRIRWNMAIKMETGPRYFYGMLLYFYLTHFNEFPRDQKNRPILKVEHQRIWNGNADPCQQFEGRDFLFFLNKFNAQFTFQTYWTK